jgi:hypothetical protein
MPNKITQVTHDVLVDVNAGVGSLGKVQAGQLGIKTGVVAKNLFDKYPNTDRILIAQMMAATYCPMIRDDKALKDAEKRHLWSEFQDRVFNFANPSYHPGSSETKSKSRVTPTESKQTVELSAISDAQRAALKTDLQALAGNDLRLVSVGSGASINTARQAVHDVFSGWKILDANIGQGPPIPDGCYLTSQDISSELSRKVYATFQAYGVKLPLVPDAYAGPVSLGPAAGIVIVLH